MGEHIPKFDSKEEEARFWQRRGVDQLSPDQYEEVEVERPARPLSATFAVRFEPKTVELIRHVARSQGLGATQLVRSWVLERLTIEKAVGVLAERIGEFPSDFELRLRRTIVDTLFANIPAAAEKAMQEVLDRFDQEKSDLLEP
ncbi:MAG TPA: hypothetical protein VGS09_11170 [Actinomycetota bacterium]|jgi:predicted HicB family RNase H-like nuclease|nr:hypothetical protein [Actinomycetota bacterium]